VALPAQYVFEFLRRFQDSFRKQLPLQVSFSAGVVFANHDFPIAEFVGVAEVLLRRAKDRVPNADAVDFEIITSSVSGVGGEDRRLEPTVRPYRLADFLDMESEIRGQKGAGTPTSEVRALYEIAYEGEQQAQLEYCWLLSRLEPRQRAGLRAIVECGTADGMFWRPRNGVAAYTRGGDVAELWDFIHELEIAD
jgi:hypothetical protein